MKPIPTEYHDLLKDETKAYLFLATVMADGSPQVTPVWFSADETHILVNTAKGRVKDRNMRTRPRVAMAIQDPSTPYRYLQIRGRVDGITEEGGDEHINTLSLKYDGKPWRKVEGQTRVIFKILIEHVDAH
ncbi:MAG: PPOX class F420-dependent oxidoreductase [Anaerolineaceae bacterium]|nr:MAG: PPOX class F420-dependent oxidoreductase [Anaerolineaceae bacterium]